MVSYKAEATVTADIHLLRKGHPIFRSRSKVQNYNLLAYTKYLNGKREEALENLQKAEEAASVEFSGDIEKHSLVTWGNYAWVYCHMDRLPEAQTYVKKVGSVCGQHQSDSPYKMRFPQMYNEKGWALLKFGHNYYEKAKESFEKALQEEPENPEFNAGYAITVYCLEEYYEKRSAAAGSSLEPLKLAVTLNPDDAFVVPLLALKLQETNKVKQGEKYIEEALSKHPDIPYVLRYAAKFYRKKGDVQRSLSYLTKALELTPNSAFLHHQMGLCYRAQYFEMKRTKEKYQSRKNMEELIKLCIFHFQKAVERKTNFFHAYLDLANIYAEGRQLQKAEETFQNIFAKKKLTCTEKQQFHLKYGLQLDGEKQEAIEYYEQALELDPGNEEYLSAILNLKFSL